MKTYYLLLAPKMMQSGETFRSDAVSKEQAPNLIATGRNLYTFWWIVKVACVLRMNEKKFFFLLSFYSHTHTSSIQTGIKAAKISREEIESGTNELRNNIHDGLLVFDDCWLVADESPKLAASYRVAGIVSI